MMKSKFTPQRASVASFALVTAFACTSGHPLSTSASTSTNAGRTPSSTTSSQTGGPSTGSTGGTSGTQGHLTTSASTGSSSTTASQTTGATSGSTPTLKCPEGSRCLYADAGPSVCCGGVCIDPNGCPCGGCPEGEDCDAGFCLPPATCVGIGPFYIGIGGGSGCTPPNGASGTGICGNSSCVDGNTYLSDPSNCGAPGISCPGQGTCSAGTCIDSAGHLATCDSGCSVGQGCVESHWSAGCAPSTCGADNAACVLSSGGHGVCCNARCVNPLSDPLHCNGCGFVCQNGQTCSDGQCTLAQPSCSLGRAGQACSLDGGSGGTCCGTACVDLLNDSQNCLACGGICPTGSMCILGNCVSPGSLSNVSCGDGDAGAACPSGTMCLGGRCVSMTCGGTLGGACVGGTCCQTGCANLRSDPVNCGQCGTTCPSGLCVAGSCFPLATDAGCPQGCPSQDVCIDGVCFFSSTAGGGFCDLSGRLGIKCESGCVDPTSDVQNCGGCGLSCVFGSVCTKGHCS